MDIKTRLTRCCGKPTGGDNCREGLRCSDCFDKLEGLREIERLQAGLRVIADSSEGWGSFAEQVLKGEGKNNELHR